MVALSYVQLSHDPALTPGRDIRDIDGLDAALQVNIMRERRGGKRGEGNQLSLFFAACRRIDLTDLVSKGGDLFAQFFLLSFQGVQRRLFPCKRIVLLNRAAATGGQQQGRSKDNSQYLMHKKCF